MYALSQGLFALSTAVLAKRAIQLGGTHWHVLFCLNTDDSLTSHRKADSDYERFEENASAFNS